MTTTRWALVPIEATPEIFAALYSPVFATYKQAYAEMIEVSPDSALLAEVLAARDFAKIAVYGTDQGLAVFEILLAALDKLGPAAEGAA